MNLQRPFLRMMRKGVWEKEPKKKKKQARCESLGSWLCFWVLVFFFFFFRSRFFSCPLLRMIRGEKDKKNRGRIFFFFFREIRFRVGCWMEGFSDVKEKKKQFGD